MKPNRKKQLAALNRRIAMKANRELERIKNLQLKHERLKPRPGEEPKFLCQNMRNWIVPTHCGYCGEKLRPEVDFFDICKRCDMERDEVFDATHRRRRIRYEI